MAQLSKKPDVRQMYLQTQLRSLFKSVLLCKTNHSVVYKEQWVYQFLLTMESKVYIRHQEILLSFDLFDIRKENSRLKIWISKLGENGTKKKKKEKKEEKNNKVRRKPPQSGTIKSTAPLWEIKYEQNKTKRGLWDPPSPSHSFGHSSLATAAWPVHCVNVC